MNFAWRIVEGFLGAAILVVFAPVIALAHVARWMDSGVTEAESPRTCDGVSLASRCPKKTCKIDAKLQTAGRVVAAGLLATAILGCERQPEPPTAWWEGFYPPSDAEFTTPPDQTGFPPFANPWDEPTTNVAMGEEAFWNAVHNGLTVRTWYDIAYDKTRGKLRREDAILELSRAGQAGAFALAKLLEARDADTLFDTAEFGYATREHSPGFVRMYAARHLGLMGQLAWPAAPKLAELAVRDESLNVRAEALVALARTQADQPGVVEAIYQVLQSDQYAVWPHAVAALGAIRPHDPQTVATMQRIAAIDRYSLGTGNDGISLLNAIMEAKRFLLSR